MRIGLIVENAAAFVCEEVAALRRLGHEVEVASVFRPLPPERWRQAYAGPVDYPRAGAGRWVALGASAAARTPARLGRLGVLARSEGAPLRLVLVAAELARRARREGWDHVHGSFASFPAWTASAVSRVARIPFSFTGHAYDVQHPRPWLPRLIDEASFVRAISRETAERLRRQARSAAAEARIQVGHLGVDSIRFAPGSVGAAGAAPEIVAVANLVAPKGLPVLVEAAARLARDERAFRVRILGDGPLRASLERQVESLGLAGRVCLEGAADRVAVRAALARARVFALPCIDLGGRHDGLPVAILEAMACAVPVVSTTVGGIRDAIQHEHNGLLVPPGNSRALAEALASLLDDASLCRRLGAEGRATVEARFRLDRSAARLADWMAGSRAAVP